jgi:outer membrane protein OmpA-like peptidoglycan-associated protein
VRAKPSVILGGYWERFAWSTELGFTLRESRELGALLPLRTGSGVTFSLGAFYALDPQKQLCINVEARVTSALSSGAKLFDTRSSGLELLVGSTWRVLHSPLEFGLALGPGIGQAPGIADYRALMSLAWVPEEPPPPPDRDADSVPDEADICTDVPGVPSADPLMHGCPELPADADGDSIPDGYDACPKQPGEATGIRRTHGCPITHNRVPEAVTPKPTEPTATLVETSIVISEQVQFETGTAALRAESDRVLSSVLNVINQHPEIELIEVEGHTDDTGNAEFNEKLAFDRATSVVRWLVGRGVAAERLQAKGYGARVPLADNTSEAGRARNRRVAFTLRKTRAAAEEPSP